MTRGRGLVEVTISVVNGRIIIPTGSVTVLSGGSSTSSITFEGTVADINSSLNSFTFAPDANFVGLGQVQVTVDDRGHAGVGGPYSVTETLYVRVLPVNDAPGFANLNGAVSYTEGSTPVVLDPDVTVQDVELGSRNGGLGNYSGSTVTLVRNGGAATEDLLGFSDGNGITLSGTSLYKNGIVIATFDTTSTVGELVITFTDANGEIPTAADVESILRQVTYANNSDNPPASVQIDWSFDDGNTDNSQGSGGFLSASGSTTVNIIGVNDAPVASHGGAYTIAEGESLTLDASGTTDVDSGTLTYRWDLNNDAIYDITTTSSTITPAWSALTSYGIDDDGVYTIGLQVDDGNGGVVTTSTTVTVSNVAPDVDGVGRGDCWWRSDVHADSDGCRPWERHNYELDGQLGRRDDRHLRGRPSLRDTCLFQ